MLSSYQDERLSALKSQMLIDLSDRWEIIFLLQWKPGQQRTWISYWKTFTSRSRVSVNTKKIKQKWSNEASTCDWLSLFTVVSEELVVLLQSRHELREQVDMRRIAIEQLLRLHTDDKESSSKRETSVHMGVVLPDRPGLSSQRWPW